MSDAEPASRPYPDPEHSLAPRKPRTLGGVVYLVVLAVTAAGLVLVGLDQWRLGLSVMGGAMVAAGAVRLVLRDDNAGMLGLRRKLVDVTTLLLLGTALLVLSAVIPTRTLG